MTVNDYLCKHYETDSKGDISIISFLKQSFFKLLMWTLLCATAMITALVVLFGLVISIVGLGVIVQIIIHQELVVEVEPNNFIVGIVLFVMLTSVTYVLVNTKIAHCETKKKTLSKEEEEDKYAGNIARAIIVLIMITLVGIGCLLMRENLDEIYIGLIISGICCLAFAFSLPIAVHAEQNKPIKRLMAHEMDVIKKVK